MHRAIGLLLILVSSGMGCDRGPVKTTEPASSASISSSAQVLHAPPKKPPQPAGPLELALIAPLIVGSTLEGYSVKAVNAVEDGILVIQFEKERAKIRVWVALAEEGGPSPPASAGKYAVFYSLRGAESEDGEKLAKAIAAILEKHADIPAPPGLGRFVPEVVPI